MNDRYIPGLAGVPAIKSSISSINTQEGMLFYRGYPIDEVVSHLTFEKTSLLLLEGELPNASAMKEYQGFLDEFSTYDFNLEALLNACDKNTHPMHLLQSVFPLLSQHAKADWSPRRTLAFLLSIAYRAIAMWEQMRLAKQCVFARPGLSIANNFLRMFGGEQMATPEFIKMMDVCLMLHAEHTTNASTFASLVVASTLAEPCAAISAGIGALSGPLHGGANERVVLMLREITNVSEVPAYVDKKLSAKGVIWGMGHREYSSKDPRAVILEEMIKSLLKTQENSDQNKISDQQLEIALEVERVCGDRLGHKGVYPNVDFYSGILYQKMGIPVDQFTAIFALSRISGWFAHYVQQISNNKIFRPTQVYLGPNRRSI